MADNEYINSGYITKMGDNNTHNGNAGQPVDGTDFPHSGLIKALNAMATTGYAGLTASTGTGSKNFNMQMNDSSGQTVITVRTGKVIRGGVLMGATTEATITEIIHSGSMTDTSIQFQEVTADSAGDNRYHLIVVDSSNVVKIRQSPGVDKVADLNDGDIPIAVLRMQKGEAKATRHIQYLTSSATDGIGLDIDGYSALGGTGLHQTQDHFVFSDNGTEKKISFTNLEDAIFGNVSGDIAIAAGGAATIQADSVEGSMINDNAISGQAEMTGDVADTDELLVSDAGTLKRADFSVVRDAVFNDVSGDVTIAAGGAATIQANSVALGTDTVGNYMTDVSAGTGIDVTHTPAEGSTATIAVDVSDFMTNGANNRVVTATGTDGMNAEAGLTYDGATLAVTDMITAVTSVTAPEMVSSVFQKANGLEMVGAEILEDGFSAPVISGTKSIVYATAITTATPTNTLELPRASTVNTARLTIKNVNSATIGAASQQAITIIPLGGTGDEIDFGQTDHPYVTSANVITLAVGQSITLQAITQDYLGPLVTGWYVIGF